MQGDVYLPLEVLETAFWSVPFQIGEAQVSLRSVVWDEMEPAESVRLDNEEFHN
jgi:hypothetical protein